MKLTQRIAALFRRTPRERWQFHNLENATLFTPSGRMTEGEALDYLAGRASADYFLIDSIDRESSIIRYRVDYLIYRDRVPCHWNAVCVGQNGGGEFKIPNVTRQGAIDAVTKNRAHSLFYVDDRAAIVFYKPA